MDKFKLIDSIKVLYEKGENIIQYLRDVDKRNFNTIEDILISYDFQAGSYIKHFYSNQDFQKKYAENIASTINRLGLFNSVMEAGVGEATTLGVMIKFLSQKPRHAFGFDLSWSRLFFAQNFLKDQDVTNATLFTSDLFEIALPDNSIDLVYTSHSVEPNGGKEKEALIELYRVAKKYLVLLEPSYEFGSHAARQRMEKLGYVTNLYATAIDLGYEVIEHRIFDSYNNPLNPTGLLIIKKNSSESDVNEPYLACPVTKTKLKNDKNTTLYSEESLLAYPIIKSIPCLLKQNAILATHFNMDYDKFKSATDI
jgi:uncharacterized protein YbaR (Trm112 family)/ubiquinone/menaquinone biosynthesis C-methylase UbiE